MLFSDETDYSLEEAQILSQLGEILSIKLIETLREEIGGVYGVGASGSLSKTPYGSYRFTIQWPCAPDNVEVLTDAAWREIEKIKENGPTAEDLAKVQETSKRQLAENKQRNGYWMGQLSSVATGDYGKELITNIESRIEGVSM
jgi:zinc protease